MLYLPATKWEFIIIREQTARHGPSTRGLMSERLSTGIRIRASAIRRNLQAVVVWIKERKISRSQTETATRITHCFLSRSFSMGQALILDTEAITKPGS